MLPQVSHQTFSFFPYFYMLRLQSLEKAIMGHYLLYFKLLLEPCSDYRHPKLWLTILSFLYWLFLILGYTSCFNLLRGVCVPCITIYWTTEMIQSLKKRKRPGKTCWYWYYPANSSYQCSEEDDNLWNFPVSLWLRSHYMLILNLHRECIAQQERTRNATTSWIATIDCKQLSCCRRKFVFLQQKQSGKHRGLRHSSCARQHPLAHDLNLWLYINLWNKWIHNSVVLNFP